MKDPSWSRGFGVKHILRKLDVCIVAIKLFGFIRVSMAKSITNVKSAEGLTTNKITKEFC